MPSLEGVHSEKEVNNLLHAPYLFIHRPLIRIIPCIPWSPKLILKSKILHKNSRQEHANAPKVGNTGENEFHGRVAKEKAE